mgnify:CR=1 FL=1
MANTFSVQVQDLVGTFSDEAALDQWMSDGAKEIINLLPSHLLKLCTTTDTYTSQAVGSESSAATLNTGKILSVFAGNYEARLIPNSKKHKAANNKSIEYAVSTNPVYYVEGNYLNSLPSGLSCVYEEVQYPTVDASADTAISAISLTGVTVTKANPASFTKASHGLSVGDTVHLSNFQEMTELNGMSTQVATTPDGNTFTLEGIDSTNYGSAESTGGNVLKKGAFPDEAEYLVVLYTAIKAVEQMLATNEDLELYTPMLQNLKVDYSQGIEILLSGSGVRKGKANDRK